MPTTPKILAFSGSVRRDSLNDKLVRVAAEIAKNLGAEVTVVSPEEMRFPIFSQDLEDEDGIPVRVRDLRRKMIQHHALLIASPEYNSSITPQLKNVIDWCSREDGEDPGLIAYRGKTAALISASPGALGGLRGLRHVREILGNIGVMVVPDQFALSSAHEAFDAQDALVDPRQRGRLERVVAALVATTAKLVS